MALGQGLHRLDGAHSGLCRRAHHNNFARSLGHQTSTCPSNWHQPDGIELQIVSCRYRPSSVACLYPVRTRLVIGRDNPEPHPGYEHFIASNPAPGAEPTLSFATTNLPPLPTPVAFGPSLGGAPNAYTAHENPLRQPASTGGVGGIRAKGTNGYAMCIVPRNSCQIHMRTCSQNAPGATL